MDPIGACASWDNNADVNCYDAMGAVPGNGAKCTCEPATVIPPIPVPPPMGVPAASIVTLVGLAAGLVLVAVAFGWIRKRRMSDS
jgi:hypothetical protein